MKTVTYKLLDGTDKTIEYDEAAPCWYCELPVGSASMDGTVVCPACDCGMHRDGRQWTYQEALQFYENFRNHRVPSNTKGE